MNNCKSPPKEAESSIRNNFDNMIIMPEPFKILWRPNNYRRRTTFKTTKKSSIGNKPPYPPISCGEFSHTSQSKLTYAKNYHGVTIQLGKEKITAIYSQKLIDGQKEVWLISRPTMPELDQALEKKKEEIRTQMDHALKMFAREFDLKLEGSLTWTRYEDWIKGEEFIDNLPEHLIIHDTYFKKVYKGGIEFKSSGQGESPTASIRNYIKNRAVEDIAPEIATSLDNLRKGIARLNPLESLKSLIWGVQALENPTPQMFALTKALSEDELLEFTNWIIEKFEGEDLG